MANSRRSGSRQTNRTVLIVTNGEKTEKSYLNKLKQMHSRRGISIKVQVVRGQPKTVFQDLTNPKGDTSAYDEVWIVVDEDGIDRSAFVAQCKKQASKKQIWCALVSRPCFEVWLVAHYEQVRNYQDAKDVQSHYKRLVPAETPEKALPRNFPWQHLDDALTRCRLTNTRPCDLHELPPSPGSAMPLLVEALRANR